MAELVVKGADDLIKKLKKNANLNDVKNVVKLNGSEMQGKAQHHAPYNTGFLQRHIMLHIEDNGLTARVSSEAEYAGYQEWGTRFQSGTPHIRPSYHEQKGEFKSDLNRLTK